ncbi:MAG: dTDP-glucose 4,6-dehydratase [Candidatus Doudnabacteria bacterium RIFCSPHIGHO2_01_FULL_46_14]|uniref:dTDP-glucose 4,6-dehydratase n=1 Tax=Candidatus Doudnabacteria bacterium RIFCSPHIGHO2_01_FULL_46_14 TaxID=1817824 RepID=A0A1F5NPH3_9BACT|nr:MAG: dTDP-glucose 4,6-dehydratase [Candidatus Doudnabacteria bacterium RIFCSPHIGHO2_01_FULL_46_14]
MKLLVTGGAGFIGSNFIRHWLKNHPQDEIISYDKLTYAGNRDNLKDVAENKNYKFVWGDICDLFLLQKTLRENAIDTIVHFAASTHVDRSILEAKKQKHAKDVVDLFTESLSSDFVLNNVWGTQVLLEAALKAGVKRFHHISTDEVFGHIPLESKSKFNESSMYSPRSPYAASKAAADHLVMAYHNTYGLPVTVTNCSNNYGPYHFPEKFIPLAITNLLEGKKIPVYKPGNQIRDWLHVEDHYRAVEMVLLRGKIGDTYCVGGMPGEISNLDVAKMIVKILGKSEDDITYVVDRPGHDVKYAIDWSKIKTLGWEPQKDFEHGLAETAAWYQQNEWWWKPLKEKNKEYYQQQYGN